MKILQINSVCGIGSTGRIATYIHNILVDQGHESYIAYGRDSPKNCDTSIRIGTKYDNYAHGAITRIFDLHGFGSKKATHTFLEKVRELNPDIIHLHNIHGFYINIEMLFSFLKEEKIPVIWTLHDCWAFTGHCAHFEYVGCDKWKSGCFQCPQKNEYPKSVFMDNSKSNFLRKKSIFLGLENLSIITPSRWLAKLVKKSFLNEYPVKVINNGIDLEVFKPTKSDFRKRYILENKFLILGVAGVWGHRKGLDHFIELSRRLEDDEVIVLVGVTKNQRNNLPQNIIGIERTNNTEELAEIYSTSNIFVNPTLEDNFPTVNMEAMACGTPFIAFDTGGIPEQVIKECGATVSKGNIKELYSLIKEVKNNGKFKHMEINIEKSNVNFNQKSKFEEYLSLYKIINKI